MLNSGLGFAVNHFDAIAARIEAEQLHSWQHTAQELTQLFTQVIRS